MVLVCVCVVVMICRVFQLKEAMAFALVIGSLSGIFRAGYNLCCCVCAILLNVSQLFPNSINLMHCPGVVKGVY